MPNEDGATCEFDDFKSPQIGAQRFEEASPNSALERGTKKHHDFESVIKNGCYDEFDNDRSRAVWFVVNESLRHSKTKEEIVAALLNRNNAISAHIYDQNNPAEYARKQVEKAIAQAPNIDADIKRLARLTAIQYEQQRKVAAERLGIRASILDRLVQGERADDTSKQGKGIAFKAPEPWPDEVDGAALLSAIADAIQTYIILSDHACVASSLWVLHTHLLDCFMVSPRLAVDSPTKGCGKTTFLDVLSRLVLKPLPTANVTPSVVFRVVEAQRPTLLIDEGDSFLRDNDELRGVLNSGHRKGGGVLRSVGDEHEPRWFATYSACAIALIGRLPETLHDRSVVINLKRRLPNEVIRSFRSDKAEHLDVLARQVARWAKDNASKIAEADPAMSKGIYNRESDNWRGLIAIADAAGGEWPKLARKALEQCHAEADEEAELGMLLTDIKSIFTGRNTDRVPSHVIVMELWDFEGRPWAEYSYGKPISQNQLARALKPLGIVSQTIRMPDDKTPKGYYLHQFADAFARYLLDSPSQTATPQQMP